MPISALPPAPQPTDTQAQFNTKAFNLVAALSTFVTQTNAVETAVDADAAAASAAANTASNAAATALAAGTGVTGTSSTSLAIGTGSKSLTIESGRAFVAGMPVRIGQAGANANTNYMDGEVISYDPSSGALVVAIADIGGDGTFASWSVRAAPFVSGITVGSEARTASVTLTAKSKQVQVLAPTGYGMFVRFPSALTMTPQADAFILDNSTGRFPVGVQDGAGAVLGQVLPGESVRFTLRSSATAAGEWTTADNLDPWWIDTNTGFDLPAGASGSGIAPTLFAFDGTRSIISYRNTSGFPCIRLVTYNAAGVAPTISAELVVRASADGLSSSRVYKVDANRMLLSTNSHFLVLVDLTNPSTLSAGTPVSLAFTGSAGPGGILNLDSRYLVAYAPVTSNTIMEARCIDCGASGTTLTLGVTQQLNPFSSSGIENTHVQIAGSNVLGFALRDNTGTAGGIYYIVRFFTLTRTTGTTLSWSAAFDASNFLAGWNISNANQLWEPQQIASERMLFTYITSSIARRYVVITFAASSTPTAGTVVNGVLNINSAFVTSPDKTRFIEYDRGSTNTWRSIVAFTIAGSTITMGAAQTFTGDATINPGSATALIDNNGRGVITWRSNTGSSTDKLRTFTLSGTVFTFATEMNSAERAGLGGAGQFSCNLLSTFDNLFVLSSGVNNSGAGRHNYLFEFFTINADRTRNVIATLEQTTSGNGWLMGVNNVTDRLIGNQVFTDSGGIRHPSTENIVVFTNGRVKRGNTIPGYNALSVSNDPANSSGRRMPAGFLQPDMREGRNCTLLTYQFAGA